MFDVWLVVVVSLLVVASLFFCGVCGLFRSSSSLHTGVQQPEFVPPCGCCDRILELPKDGGPAVGSFFPEHVGNTGTSVGLSTVGNLLAVGIVVAAVPVEEAPGLRQVRYDEPWVRFPHGILVPCRAPR